MLFGADLGNTSIMIHCCQSQYMVRVPVILKTVMHLLTENIFYLYNDNKYCIYKHVSKSKAAAWTSVFVPKKVRMNLAWRAWFIHIISHIHIISARLFHVFAILIKIMLFFLGVFCYQLFSHTHQDSCFHSHHWHVLWAGQWYHPFSIIFLVLV